MEYNFPKIQRQSTKLLQILFLLISFFSLAQQSKEEKEIEAQIHIADGFYQNLKIEELLKISQDIILKSEKINYEKGLAHGYYSRACVLHTIGNYKKSIFYLNKAKAYTKYIKEDPEFLANIYNILSANYNRLELYSLASKNVLQAIDILNKIETIDNGLLHNQSSNYANLSSIYSGMGKEDSAYYFLQKERKILSKITSSGVDRQKALSDINLGNHFYMLEKDDSARYYYTKALSRLEGKGHLYKVGGILGLGNLDYEENKLDDAIRNYSQALELIKKQKLSFGLSEAYQGLEQVYEKKGEYQKAKAYEALYKKIDDSVSAAKKMQRDSIINEVIKFEKEEEQEKSNQKFIKIASIVGIVILLFSIGAFYFVKRKRREFIVEKENIIQEKEFENRDLKQKINESFEEVVHLAKDNNPEFLTRFQEVYPDFSKNLLQINPNLVASELRFCALLFLNFSTKDISEYTFTSTKTVQNRKNSIRKKLNIASDEDLYVWFKNF